ncbi:MAG: hypothetical protein PHN49_00855 [Candidatus Omnitrophica bacterium]|nr:hypothetical protein [Candidatus Omnitrophota bacterium]MDD5670172.1 hypothetical protein [Candidatus Omnitrophota bacterium]
MRTLLGLLITLLILYPTVIFPFWMFINCARRDDRSGNFRAVWIVIMLATYPLGTYAYGLFGSNRGKIKLIALSILVGCAILVIVLLSSMAFLVQGLLQGAQGGRFQSRSSGPGRVYSGYSGPSQPMMVPTVPAQEPAQMNQPEPQATDITKAAESIMTTVLPPQQELMTIKLKSGNVIQGTIVNEDEQKIVLRISNEGDSGGYADVVFNRYEIVSIRGGSQGEEKTGA